RRRTYLRPPQDEADTRPTSCHLDSFRPGTALEIDAGVARRRRGFARERELPHLAIARTVVDLQHRLRVDVADHVLALTVHAAERDLAARHDRQLVPAETTGAGHAALAARLHLAAPVALADHERPESRIALPHKGKEPLVARAAVGHPRDRHFMRIAACNHAL